MHRVAVLSVSLGLLLVTGAAADAGRGDHALPAHKEKNVCAPERGDVAACSAKVVTALDGVSPLATPSQYALSRM